MLPPFVETQRLTTKDWPYYVPTPSEDGSEQDTFGDGDIALDGNIAAIGLSRGVDYSSGDVFLLQKKEENNDGDDMKWTAQAIVKASDGDEYDRFGESISLHQGTLVVGAPYDDFYTNERIGDPGAAYVFGYDKNNRVWTERAKLQPADITKYSYYFFGYSVAVLHDTIVVGAIQNNHNVDAPGAAYVFSRATSADGVATMWAQTAKLSASDGGDAPQGHRKNYFGRDIALTNDVIAIAACPSKGNGAVYVYWRSDDEAEGNNDDDSESVWSEIKIDSPTANDGEALFGYSVAASGNTIVVGAPGTNNQRGSVYVYQKKYGESGIQYTQSAELVADNPMDKDYFGLNVDISADESTIVIGAGISYVSKSGRRFVYNFSREMGDDSGDELQHFYWLLEKRIAYDSFSKQAEFGRNLALSSSGDTLFVGLAGGARYDGSVIVFERGGKPIIEPRRAIPQPSDWKQTERGTREVSPWINLLISILVLYIIPKFLLRNGAVPRSTH